MKAKKKKLLGKIYKKSKSQTKNIILPQQNYFDIDVRIIIQLIVSK